ncbi:MAG: hypothetical protein M3O50_06760 [Myxococcota bacterium]|nr:hypothetical protein [Myxococcota bacterium]
MRPKRSDQETLRHLLDCREIKPEERAAVQGLWDDLLAKRIAAVPEKTRVWIDALHDETYKLNEPRPRPASKAGASKREQIAAFDAMPRPKRPPGK